MTTPILDVCCSARRFWFDKHNPLATFMDNREGKWELCDGRTFEVKPDIIGDFTNIPFEEKTFSLVVFDPPHMLHIGAKAYTSIEYGKLPDDWQETLRKGFDECMRVLKPNGVLIFKWNNHDIKVSKIIEVLGQQPLFGHKTRAIKRNSTHWLCFMKVVS